MTSITSPLHHREHSYQLRPLILVPDHVHHLVVPMKNKYIYMYYIYMYKDKDKYIDKALQWLNVCYIFEKHGFQVRYFLIKTLHQKNFAQGFMYPGPE